MAKSKSRPKDKSKPNRKRVPQVYIKEDDPNIPDTSLDGTPERRKIKSFQARRMEAIQLLNGKNMPNKFTYRETQINDITNCINQFFNTKFSLNKVVMVTGSPGSGKTLSVNHILRQRKQKVIKLNGNLLKSLKDIHWKLCDELLGREDGRQLSTIQIIRELQKKWQKECILYIEEIQILFKNAPDNFTADFFSLFNNKKIKLVLIATSNTIDTLQKYEEKLGINTNEIRNIVFEPYTSEMIKGIMTQKLQKIKEEVDLNIVFPQKMMIFCSKKIVSTRKGDLRFALQFLKQIISDILYHHYNHQLAQQTITMQITQKIFAKMNQQKDALITSIPLDQQILLLALHVYVKKTDAIEVTYPELTKDLKWVCESIKIPNKPSLVNGFDQLQQYGFISRRVKNGATKILLKLSVNEIQASFADHPIFKRFFDSE